jgi:hypothetical protein
MSKRRDRWFRFYEDAVNNPKAQRLPGELFKFWVNCLCLASKNDGELPDVADVAWALRLPEKRVAEWLAALEAAVLLDVDAETGRYLPHDWDEHQYQSDRSTERVKRFRERQVKRSGNVSCAVSETAPDTDTDTDTDTEVEAAQAPPPQRRRGTRLPDDWEPTPADLAFAGQHGWAGTGLINEALKFRNYWTAKAGASAVKLDWHRTFCNWLLTARQGAQSRPTGPTTDELMRMIG